MNRRKFFKSLGLAAIFAPLAKSVKHAPIGKWEFFSRGSLGAETIIPIEGHEGPFYGVDFGEDLNMSHIIEMWIKGPERVVTNIYPISVNEITGFDGFYVNHKKIDARRFIPMNPTAIKIK
jgi:hypothetical protein